MILNGENILSATNGPVDIRSILKATTMNIVIDLDAFDVIGSLLNALAVEVLVEVWVEVRV